MEDQLEPWVLGSGTWHRDLRSEEWRLVATKAGVGVDPSVPARDVARLADARPDPESGKWFPPDFRYSLLTGARLPDTSASDAAFSWIPPFGEAALPPGQRLARGVRRTSASLALAHAQDRSAGSGPDGTLPPLPRGQYRFVVDRFDVSCPTLLAIEPEQGRLLALLPESLHWMPLEPIGGRSWAQRLRNPQGWRMELVHVDGHATAYVPSVTGLAAITPSVFARRYTVEFAGEGPAVGGPVACGGDIWMPVHGKQNMVHLVCKGYAGAAHPPLVFATPIPVPAHGFEPPVFNDLHVTWPCEQGQLVLQFDANGGKRALWVPWPEDLKPIFGLGCPYMQQNGSFWQLCSRNDGAGFDYVQMAVESPDSATLDELRLCTGRVCYRDATRIDDGRWRGTRSADDAPPEVVVPLLESSHDGAVIGLRMEARQGMLALLRSNDPIRAVLQIEVEGQPALSFGEIAVKKPWLALLFVYEGHLWVHHPDLARAVGWKLAAAS